MGCGWRLSGVDGMVVVVVVRWVGGREKDGLWRGWLCL